MNCELTDILAFPKECVDLLKAVVASRARWEGRSGAKSKMRIQTQVIARQAQHNMRQRFIPPFSSPSRFAYVHIVEEATKAKESLSTHTSSQTHHQGSELEVSTSQRAIQTS
jgi:hypothetical protein